jgi:hypothetical protein
LLSLAIIVTNFIIAAASTITSTIDYRHGYADCPEDWSDFRKEVCHRPEFRFDFYFKSRSAPDLQRRSDFLIRMTEKDNTRTVEMKQLALDLAQKEERARKRAVKKEIKLQKDQEMGIVVNGSEDAHTPVTEITLVATDTQPTLVSSVVPVVAVSVTSLPAAQKKPAVIKKKRDRRPIMGDAVDGGRTYNKKPRTSRGAPPLSTGTSTTDTGAGRGVVMEAALGGGEGGGLSKVTTTDVRTQPMVMGGESQESQSQCQSQDTHDDTAIVFEVPSSS